MGMTQKAIHRLTRTPEVDALVAEAECCAEARGEKDTSIAGLLRLGLQAYIAQRPAAAPTTPTGTDAERLKRARERAGLSMGAVARACGLEGHHRVSQIERGLAPLTGRVLEWVEAQERA